MNEIERASRERRVEIARQAFQEFYARCFWSYRRDLQITEGEIPFIIRELRRNGGHPGYKVVAELCQ
jgi:hypothetical protein